MYFRLSSRCASAISAPANIPLDFRILISDEIIVGDSFMRFRRREPLLSVLLDTGLHLLDLVRERLPDNVYDLKDAVRDTYGVASDRVSRATSALRGEEDSHIWGTVGVLLLGLGIGAGIGILLAPAAGGEARTNLTEKVSEFGDKVRERAGNTSPSATGTEG